MQIHTFATFATDCDKCVCDKWVPVFEVFLYLKHPNKYTICVNMSSINTYHRED